MTYSCSMFGELQRVIVKHPKDGFMSQEHLHKQWKVFNYIEEPDYEMALEEYGSFLEILKQYVEQIDYLPPSDKVGPDSIYTHDPVKFTEEGAIVLKSGKKLRQSETQLFKEFLQQKKIPIIGELTDDARADGGDIIWLDEDTLLVGRGYRTNDEAIRQLKEITAPFVKEFIVVQLPHDRGETECLHLMSFLSMVDNDLAVVYSSLMPVFLRQLLLERGINLIEVPEEEYENLGSNVLALAPRICMMTTGNDLTKKRLENAGATVLVYKGREISYLGTGGPTCLTSPVVRRKV